ncbi:hypothetical protein EC973_002385 [Apophysomyces ossiformis]|uniref:WRKY domain-containing protein n=1 Tax=Apophysomyces ossiformis TaxID=679940 RepID=A0A8H7BIF3_9FUNG|nr:hypothetical protein EC973_002385 [Apophysomyces ossiformis]
METSDITSRNNIPAKRSHSLSSLMNPEPSEQLKTEPLFCELKNIVAQYELQPELLRLILTSKIEEDKRRTEEAKLRFKQLDLYLQKHGASETPDSSGGTSTSYSQQEAPQKRRRLSSQQYYETPSSSTVKLSLYDHHERRQSAAAAMLAMGSNLTARSSSIPSPSPPNTFYPSPIEICDDMNDSLLPPSAGRRRREVLSISKIVETHDFPYYDGYFWKNNGNTTQKKTGCKSTYYKCSHSAQGCPVNKTVTAKENGNYIIKYRGEHLPICGKVERICDL